MKESYIPVLQVWDACGMWYKNLDDSEINGTLYFSVKVNTLI